MCTGDSLCTEICPELFDMGDDRLAYVKEVDWPTIYGPRGAVGAEPALQMGEGQATIPEDILEAVIEAVEECHGECIYIEEE